ncbi:ABC transporter permease [Chelatococcus asaccharovorans]|uniref:Peptide/nickel transport system permease protein n=1 Tax=Chelatococcus asaccharovorans TaxID=28210 RepID=A0A2V3U283_9HYPH|nr:ABC transporter permease [Chelatococcus asaccharovorans]MBS7702196.1 ABC transporter permease [Chelatococcus asaccharovorans]PXW56606.1 peptide/nickel transport system permease protein [Chelatococcus asaccharovorans]CAH1668576.1 glutathione ABC transporter membrane subunit GsiD [Chelatococcus asaccharovorans]CAH1679969.1 glutathione ABC transporter membrane subunit GsiD [Chelatococcus asaccharovorans]
MTDAALSFERPSVSPTQASLKRLFRSRSFMIGAALVILMALVALFADALAPFDPLRSNARMRLTAPNETYWFGTDHFGRDILSRVMVGARISLAIGAMTVVLTGITGTIVGAVAGFFPRLDNPIMRLMDALMAFPSIVLAMVVSAVLGASLTNVVIALSIATMPHTARIVRASVLVGRELDYVDAARSVGVTEMTILFRHVLINATGPLIVRLTYVFAIAILAEAALSFVGAGPPPPTPSFGAIIAQGRDFMREAPWITIFPGLAIVICVLGLNLLGDGLRDAFDPRSKL